jgi:UDP-glucose 4-epimerase
MTRVLVTGAAGFVGSTLVPMLRQLGHEVLALDNFTYGQARRPALERVAEVRQADILDEDAMLAALRSFRPDAVMHLAAMHFIPDCNRRPVDATRINVLGTESLLRACRAAGGMRRVILTSSAAVYPISDEALSDDSPAEPTDIYGITKAANEWQGQRFADLTGIDAVSVRLFNVFGPGETSPHVIPEIIEQVRRGAPALDLGNVEPKRSYIHVADVARGFIALMDCPLPAPHTRVNLGHHEEASVREVVAHIERLVGRPIEIRQDPARVRKSDRMYLRCDYTRLKRLTGWTPRMSLEEGLRDLLQTEKIACV